MRIPRKISLPWGWDIKVKQVTDSYLKNEWGVDDVDGLWDVDTRTIFLRRSLSVVEKVEVLGHEVDHLINDWRRATVQRAGFYQQSQKARQKAAKKATRRCK